MRHLALSAVVLLVGCGGYKMYDPHTLIDGEPALIEKASYGGQGHISITVEGDKRTVEVVQFGISDIAGGTIKNAFSVVGGIFGGNPAPPEIIINMPGVDQAIGPGNTDAGDDR
jgi:hypothetical protein